MNNMVSSPSQEAPAQPAEQLSFRQRLRERLSNVVAQLAAAGALLVIFVLLCFVSPVFLSFNNLFNIVAQTTVTAVIALGMTLVIITAGIDLSVGSTAALGGMTGTLVMAQVGWPLGVLIGTLVGGAVGLLNGLLITKANLNPFIATLGSQSAIRGLVYLSTNAVGVYNLPPDFAILGNGSIFGIPVPLLILVLLAGLMHLVLSFTRLGRHAYAIGSNEEAARLSGISITRTLIAIYVILGLLAGFGGMIASSRVISGQPNFGIGLELDIIAATVIGGASLFGGQGTILGTLIGAFLIALIRNGAVLLNINEFYQDIIIGVVIWLAVYWDQFRRRRLMKAV
ncbi:MAG TPA: ABC transporter permease [Ktedonobacteraceae bacterium]|nr:ABC transporter permease [Ktedonobacteraceae bacterium]